MGVDVRGIGYVQGDVKKKKKSNVRERETKCGDIKRVHPILSQAAAMVTQPTVLQHELDKSGASGISPPLHDLPLSRGDTPALLGTVPYTHTHTCLTPFSLPAVKG